MLDGVYPDPAAHQAHRLSDQSGLALQLQQSVPQVAAVRALGIEQHTHRLGGHQRADRETFALGRHGGVGLFDGDRCDGGGRVLRRVT